MKKYKSNNLKTLVTIVVAVIIVLGVLELTNATHLFRPKKTVSGPIPTLVTADTTQVTPDPKESTSPTDKPQSSSNNGDTTSALVAPYGIFVSNHKPGQNNSNTKISSQCITAPGAKCHISLTQNNIVKTLPEKTADSNGSVFWDWDIKEAGLTGGQWTIMATATLGDQTKSTLDQVVLEVQ
jgi:hypothetical protein